MNRRRGQPSPEYPDLSVGAWNGSQTSPTRGGQRGASRKPAVDQGRSWGGYGFSRSDPGRCGVPSSLLSLSIYLGNDFDGVSIFQELRADGDHLLTELYSLDSNRAFIGGAQLHFAQTCCPFASPFLRYHHCEATGFRRIWNNGTEWHRSSRCMRNPVLA